MPRKAPDRKILAQWLGNNHQLIKDFESLFNIEVDGYFSVSGSISASSVSSNYVAKTAAYTLTATDTQVECTANSFAITLPTAVGITKKEYGIKNSGTGTITIATTSSQGIDGTTDSSTALAQWDNIRVMSNGASWIII